MFIHAKHLYNLISNAVLTVCGAIGIYKVATMQKLNVMPYLFCHVIANTSMLLPRAQTVYIYLEPNESREVRVGKIMMTSTKAGQGRTSKFHKVCSPCSIW